MASVRALAVGFMLMIAFSSDHASGNTGKAAAEATLRGAVTDENGRPIADAFISVSDSTHTNLGTAVTAPDGSYELQVAGAASYRIWAGKTSGYAFSHIPETKQTGPAGADFSLQPGGNLVLEAYGADGRRLDNGSFRQIAQDRVFLTGMDGMPAPGAFAAVHHGGSDWQWEKAHPALVVRPGKRYKIIVEWEVPEVGKLLYTLDNEGRGYEVERSGEALRLNLHLEMARSALAALRRDAGEGEAVEAIAEAARHLAAGHTAMAGDAAARARGVRALSLAVKTARQAHERLVLARAEADIETYRKGTIAIRVLDAQGNPVPDAAVAYRQTGSSFVFGANPLGDSGAFDRQLAGLMREAGINQSYITARWGLLQQSPARFDWHNIDQFQRLPSQQAMGFDLLGALSIWFPNNADFWPEFLDAADFDSFKEAVYRYGHRLAQRYAGRIDFWELNELNLASANVFGLDWDQRLAIKRVFAQAVKDANPQARILNGSTALPFEFRDSDPFPALLKEDVSSDAVGLELYYSGVNTDGHALVGLDLVSISDLLDRYESFGKPIYVKELSAPSAQIPGSSWWQRDWDEALQAEYLRKVYTIAFGKPLIQGITWSWGVSDADAWIHHGGLVDADLKPKPAYFALKDLLHAWRTEGTARTDAQGRVDFRGFAGSYEVVVSLPGGQVQQATVRIREQRHGQAVIRLGADGEQAALVEPGLANGAL